MADITQYDSPAQASFINTYSPIPFNELMQAGAMKEKQYETGLNSLQQNYEDTNNLKYIPNSKDEQYIKQTVIPHAKSIFEKYSTEDLSDPIVIRQLRMELNNGIDTQRIKDIQNSYEGYKQYIGERAKLQQKGKLSPIEGNPNNNWDSSINGTFQQLPNEWSDPIKGLQDRYFDGLKSQTMRNPHTGQPIPDARGYYTSAITANRIAQETESNLDNALATPDGQNAVALYRHQYSIPSTISDKDVLRQAMLGAGHKYIEDKTEGSPWTERELKGRDEKPNDPVRGVEKTPLVEVGQNRGVKSTDFDLQNISKIGGWFSRNYPSITGNVTDFKNSTTNDLPYSTKEYNKDLLNKPEVQNIIKLMPKELQDKFSHLKDEDWVKNNPIKSNELQSDLYGKLKNTYSQIEKSLQEGSYMQAYYPKAEEGIKDSKINNVKDQTDYIFGTNELKKISSGNYINREFIDPRTGETMSGEDFGNNVIKKEAKKNENGNISINGEYHYEHPFVAISGNDNFANSYQVSVNGKQYIMSGGETDRTDPIDNYKRNANKSYTLVHFNPGIPIDEGDGTLKIYDKGKYSILDKSTQQVLSTSDDFDQAYNEAANAIKHKR